MRGSLRHLLLDQLGPDRRSAGHRSLLSRAVGRRAGRSAGISRRTSARPCRRSWCKARSRIRARPARCGAGGVTVIGCDARFWSLGSGGPRSRPARARSCSTSRWPTEIGAEVGDEVLLRIGSASQIPPDSALGRKTETIRNRRLDGVGDHSRRRAGPLRAAPQPAASARRVRGHRNAARRAGTAGQGQRDLRCRPRRADARAGGARSLDELLAPDAGRLRHSTSSTHKLGYVQCTSNRMLLGAGGRRGGREGVCRRPSAGRASPTWPTRSPAAGARFPIRRSRRSTLPPQPPLGPFNTPEGAGDRAAGRTTKSC